MNRHKVNILQVTGEDNIRLGINLLDNNNN